MLDTNLFELQIGLEVTKSFTEQRAAPQPPPGTSLLVLEMSIRILLRIWFVRSSGNRYLNWKLPASPTRRDAM